MSKQYFWFNGEMHERVDARLDAAIGEVIKYRPYIICSDGCYGGAWRTARCDYLVLETLKDEVRRSRG